MSYSQKRRSLARQKPRPTVVHKSVSAIDEPRKSVARKRILRLRFNITKLFLICIRLLQFLTNNRCVQSCSFRRRRRAGGRSCGAILM